jgi:hypothetical protein
MTPNEQVISDIEKQVWQQIRGLAERIKEKLRAQVQYVLKGNDKVVSSTLWKSIDGDIERKADEIIITIFSNTKYAEYVHEGTGPAVGHSKYFPAITPIAAWVDEKKIAGSYSIKTKRRIASRGFQRLEENYIVAYKIAWKIYQQGIKPLKFFDIALKQLEPWIDREVSNFQPNIN